MRPLRNERKRNIGRLMLVDRPCMDSRAQHVMQLHAEENDMSPLLFLAIAWTDCLLYCQNRSIIDRSHNDHTMVTATRERESVRLYWCKVGRS